MQPCDYVAMSRLLNGKRIAQQMKDQIRKEVNALKHAPSLAAIFVGSDSASRIYVRNKAKGCQEVGINFLAEKLLADISPRELEEKILALNQDLRVDGIILQLPLPCSFPPSHFLRLIDPNKDVDGLHPLNIGLLLSARTNEDVKDVLIPCTAQAVMRLISETGIKLSGKKAVVVGRSNLVGKPVAQLLLLENATVTVCHSKTVHLAQETNQADVLVVAAGSPDLITRDHVKKDAVVIDVGINRVGNKLVGDVRFKEVAEKASWISPVPGGVGPLTVAYLLRNTVRACKFSLKGNSK